MLTQMRGFTRSWLAYLLLFVLMVAFAIWGINDVFRGAGAQNVAEIGDKAITPPMLTRELELELRNMRANGENMTQQEAVDAGLHMQVLERLIARYALDAYAEKLGVSASDAQVAEYIRSIPQLQNPITRTFDESAYDNFLQQLRFSRPEFEREIRGDLSRQSMVQSLMAGVRAPSSFGALALSYDQETRVVSIAEAPVSVLDAVPQPNDAQLQMYWEESQERLRVPEFRALTLAVARPQDFLARVDIPEQRLREEFEARRASLAQPERRSYVRLSAENEAQANDAAARLTRGDGPDAVAQALGLALARGDNQVRAEVADAPVAAAVFSLPARGVRVVQGQLTDWVVVRVENITAATEPDFATMRDELRQTIALDEAGQLLTAAVGAFEDARASGTSVAEAARQAGLGIITIPAVEVGGRSPDGQPVAELQGAVELLRTAFQTPEGEASDFLPLGQGANSADVVVSVDRITPSYVRPLAEVRERLTAEWIAREQGRRLRELGDEVIAAVRGGQDFAAAARQRGFNMVVSSATMNRRQAAQGIPARGMPNQIFAAAQGDTISDMRADGPSILVARIEQINRVDPAARAQDVEVLRMRMQVDNPFSRQEGDGLAATFGDTLQDEVVAKARVRRNEELINSTYRRTGDADEETAAQ